MPHDAIQNLSYLKAEAARLQAIGAAQIDGPDLTLTDFDIKKRRGVSQTARAFNALLKVAGLAQVPEAARFASIILARMSGARADEWREIPDYIIGAELPGEMDALRASQAKRTARAWEAFDQAQRATGRVLVNRIAGHRINIDRDKWENVATRYQSALAQAIVDIRAIAAQTPKVRGRDNYDLAAWEVWEHLPECEPLPTKIKTGDEPKRDGRRANSSEMAVRGMRAFLQDKISQGASGQTATEMLFELLAEQVLPDFIDTEPQTDAVVHYTNYSGQDTENAAKTIDAEGGGVDSSVHSEQPQTAVNQSLGEGENALNVHFEQNSALLDGETAAQDCFMPEMDHLTPPPLSEDERRELAETFSALTDHELEAHAENLLTGRFGAAPSIVDLCLVEVIASFIRANALRQRILARARLRLRTLESVATRESESRL